MEIEKNKFIIDIKPDDKIISIGNNFYIKSSENSCDLINLRQGINKNISNYIFHKNYKSIKFVSLSKKQKNYNTVNSETIFFYLDVNIICLIQFQIEELRVNDVHGTSYRNTKFYFEKFDLVKNFSKIDEIIVSHLIVAHHYYVALYDNFILINGGEYDNEWARKFNKTMTPLVIYFEFKLFQIQYFNYKLTEYANLIDGLNNLQDNIHGKYISDTDLIIMEEDNKTIIHNVIKNETKKLDHKMILYNDYLNNIYMGISNNKIVLFPVNNKNKCMANNIIFSVKLENNYILLTGKNIYEEYSTTIIYESHNFINSIEILYEIINDAINKNNNDVVLNYEKHKNHLTVLIDIKIRYCSDKLEYTLDKIQYDKIFTTEKQINDLIEQVQILQSLI